MIENYLKDLAEMSERYRKTRKGFIRVCSTLHDEKIEKEKEACSLIGMREVFDILNTHDWLQKRSSEEMEKIIFDKNNEFPEIFFATDKQEEGSFPSHNGNMLFFLKEKFYEWCDRKNIRY